MMKTRFYALLLGTCIGLAALSPAQAQFAPGASLPREDAEPMAPATTGGTSSSSTTSTGGVLASADACPEPKSALAETPDDLARIQEDITRFTLCVQRAQLLERLNELATANIDTIDSALNLTASQGLEGNAMPGVMPNPNGGIPTPSIPSMPSNFFDDVDDEPVQAARPNVGSNTGSIGSAPRASSLSNLNWQIREITGADGRLTAQLIDSDGAIIRVRQGDSLPNDAGKIKLLTNTRVEVQKDDDSQPLRWIQ